MSGIFISYRRGQAGGYAGRLADELARRFGKEQVFRDIEAISAGADFVDAIDTAVATCGALIVIITPGWADAVDEEGNRRLENPEDFVRLEIEAALRRDVWVIPVLVGGAAMPASDRLPEAIRPLARRQAHEIRDGSWDYNVDQLVATLERKGLKSVSRADADKAPAPPPARRRRRGGIGLLAAGLGGVVVATVVLLLTVNALRDGDSAPPIEAERGEESAGLDPKAPTTQASPNQPVERTPAAEEDAAVQRTRRVIAEVVARASDAEIQAFRTFDASPLELFYEGQILEDLIAALRELRASGFYSANSLHGRTFHSMSIAADGGSAVVEMTERWSSRYINEAAGACLYVPEHDAPQTLHLRRGPDGWKIDSIEHHASAPEPVRC